MNISVFCSDSFYLGAKIMLSSFLENNNFEKHNIFIISTDIQQKKINELNVFLKKRFHQEVALIRVTEKMKEGFPENERFSAAGFHKLYVFKYLPIKLDRIMCLDSDMLILRSLKNFYYQDMGEKVFIASEDKYIYKNDVKHLRELGIKEGEPYFNLGCIVIDLKKYLASYNIEEYLSWIKDNHETAKYAAQDVVNVFFKGKIKQAEYFLYNNQFFHDENLSEIEMKEIEENSVIIHYIGRIKPWNFRFDTEHKMPLVKYTFGVMKRNGMKKDYYCILIKKHLFKLKHRVLNKVKGA